MKRLLVLFVLCACTGLRGYDEAVFACSEDAQCADGFVCSRGRCAKPGADGTSCDGVDACTSGVCSKGVCCATVCEGPCASCETGTCETLPAGARGECADFACTGEDAFCGNACTPETSSTTCVDGFLCKSAQCVACVGSLTLSSTWQQRGEGTVSVGENGVTFALQGNGMFRSSVLAASTLLPIDGCSFSVDIADPGNLSGGFFTVAQSRGAADGSLLGFRLDSQGLRLICRYSNGAPCPADGRAVRASATAFSRLRVAVNADRIEWFGAAPGQSDVSLAVETGVTIPGNVVLELMTGTDNATGSTTARFSGVNLR